MKELLQQEGFEKTQTIKYYQHRDDIYSDVYCKDISDTAIIIDYNIAEFDAKGSFSYREYTNIQNQLMKKHKYLYRFLWEKIEAAEEQEKIRKILNQKFELPVTPKKNVAREGVDASYLEHHFEKVFFEMYGEGSYNLLTKEAGIVGFEGENIFADYVIEKSDEMIIIEENGEKYHHPQKTGLSRYYKQINRQNALVYQGYKVFRFSTNEIEFKDRMIEEMSVYLGKKDEFVSQNLITQERKYQLYEHQNITLKQLGEMRKEGIKSCVIVLPTGTGKSTVAEEDMKSFIEANTSDKILVLVPTAALKKQWLKNLKNFFKEEQIGEESSSQIFVSTYSRMIRQKNNFSQEEFSYIAVDEAHHSVAPGMAKVLKYFNPRFLLGMTATPERLDNKKLEEIYSRVETKLTLREAVEKGICCPIRAFRLESNISLSEVRFNGRDYIAGDLEKRIVVTSRNELIADTVDKYFGKEVEGMSEKQGIIFCVNVKHAEAMAKLLKKKGISAEAVSGKDKASEEHLNNYLAGKIRFLCSCQLISEGWDAPNTSVIVMARPTMSKVLYYQQLGRGTRKAEGKEALYLIDVVDNYSFNSVPWTANSIFGNPIYSHFCNILTGIRDLTGELLYIDHLLEKEMNLQEIDIETFENRYGDYISAEELARELFISTDTLNAWIKKGDVVPDYSVKIGKTNCYRFKPERAEEIRIQKKLKKRDNTTIAEDFWEFIEEGDYSLSYKMIFMLSFLKNIEKDGEADFEKVKSDYISYYRMRLEKGLPVDKKSCPYTEEYLSNDKEITRNIINNPFEKFERKRFIYYGKDVKNIGFSFYLWEKIDEEFLKRLKTKLLDDLENYYKDLGGAGDTKDFK